MENIDFCLFNGIIKNMWQVHVSKDQALARTSTLPHRGGIKIGLYNNLHWRWTPCDRFIFGLSFEWTDTF